MLQSPKQTYPCRKSQRDDSAEFETPQSGRNSLHSDSWLLIRNVRHIPLSHLKKFQPSSDTSIDSAHPQLPYELSPGEMAIFVFQTDQDCISDHQFSELLKLANVKVFIITTSTTDPENSRVRLKTDEVGGKQDEEMDLFGGADAANCSRFPHLSSGNPLSIGVEGISQSALQSLHLRSPIKLGSTPSGSVSNTSQCFQSSLLSSSKLDTNLSCKKLLNEVFHLSLYEAENIFSPTTLENFWNPPTMLLWRCGFASPSHYSNFFHYEPEFPQEFPAKLKEEAYTYGAILGLKSLSSPNILPCYASFPCAYTPAHLHDMTISATCKGGTEGFTVLMVSASDCPPCRRVFSQAKRLWDSLPANTSLYKVDWYLAKELRECFAVDLIPFFILLKNAEILRCPNPIACTTSSSQVSSSTLKWNAVDTLQQSDVDRIIFFIEQHTKPLSFDEDF